MLKLILKLGGKKDFGRQNNSISRTPLDSTPISTNTTNGKTSPIDLIPVLKNASAYATDTTNGFSRAKRKIARTSGPGSRPIIVRLIIKKANSSKDSNSSKLNKKKRDKKKKRRKHKKQDASDSSSKDSNSFDDSDYRRKRRKKNRHRKNDLIK